jgi:hypothetical protein
MDDLPFAALERHLDADVFALLREAGVALRESVFRLGMSPKESRLLPILEDFVATVQTLDETHKFVGIEEAREIRAFYEELAVERELPIASLDDLDDPLPWA